MHARVEFRRRNLVAVRLVRVVAHLQTVVRRVVVQVAVVLVRRLVVAALRLVAVVRLVREVAQVAVVVRAAVSGEVRAKKLGASVVANLMSSCRRRRLVIRRVRHRHQKA